MEEIEKSAETILRHQILSIFPKIQTWNRMTDSEKGDLTLEKYLAQHSNLDTNDIKAVLEAYNGYLNLANTEEEA